MAEKNTTQSFQQQESGLFIPEERKIHLPSSAEINGYGKTPNYLSQQNGGELIKDQLQRELDEKAYEDILNIANVLDLKQTIEHAQNKIGTKSDNVNNGLNLKAEKDKIRKELIEKYLHTGDGNDARTITDEVRKQLDGLLSLSYNKLEGMIESKASNDTEPADTDDDTPPAKNPKYTLPAPSPVSPQPTPSPSPTPPTTPQPPVVGGTPPRGPATPPPTLAGGTPRHPRTPDQKESFLRRHRGKLGVAALLAAGVAAASIFGLPFGKDKQKVDKIDALNIPTLSLDVDKDGEYHRGEDHVRDRMSTEGAYNDTERTAAEQDQHVLQKIINNPSLLAAATESRENGVKAKNYSLSEVNADIERFTVEGKNGEYSEAGEKAVKTVKESWENGKKLRILSENEVRSLQTKYNLVNHGTAEGQYKNAHDDMVYVAGPNYRPDLGDQIAIKEFGNGRAMLTKVNEKDPSRDCMNLQLLQEKQAQKTVKLSIEGKPMGSFVIDKENPASPDIVVDKETSSVDVSESEAETTGEHEDTKKTTTTGQGSGSTTHPKKSQQDANANPNLPEQIKVTEPVPAGEQLPATQPPEEYQEPAAPEPEPEPRPTPPPNPEVAAPTPAAPATGTVDPNQT